MNITKKKETHGTREKASGEREEGGEGVEEHPQSSSGGGFVPRGWICELGGRTRQQGKVRKCLCTG